MSNADSPSKAQSDPPPEPGDRRQSRFTVARLSSAFARLMSATTVRPNERDDSTTGSTLDQGSDHAEQAVRATPRMIVEGMLFVGRNDGCPLTSTEMASHIRDVEPEEIESTVDALNEIYQRENSAYRIERDGPGFRMCIREDLNGLRQRFRGRIRAAKLTPAALEVLSVVAYRQPVSGETVSRLRGSRSHAILAQLVRRELLRIESADPSSGGASYRTTDRFNRLFGIQSPADLPRSEDLDDG